MNYFGISQHYSPMDELDGWLRRRIRMGLLETVAQTETTNCQPAQAWDNKASGNFDRH